MSAGPSRVRCLLALASLLSCAGGEVPGDGSPHVMERDIVGGGPAPADRAVVALTFGGALYCTGSVIGPKTVLTAAHCIEPFGSASSYEVVLGEEVTAKSVRRSVGSQIRHPAFTNLDWDVGLLSLSIAITDVSPLRLRRAPLAAADLGRAVRHVGFGSSDAGPGSVGVRRSVLTFIEEVGEQTFTSAADGGQTCVGDSGGPGFLNDEQGEAIAGVVSRGDPACLTTGVDTRADVIAAWVEATRGAWDLPTCALDNQCERSCQPVDPDCHCLADGTCSAACPVPLFDVDCPRECADDGVCATASCGLPDIDCVAVGEPCGSADRCRSRTCVTDAQHEEPYCTQPCSADAECPPELHCEAGHCAFRPLPLAGLREVCGARVAHCAAGVCTGPKEEGTRCVVPCATLEDCGGGERCEEGRRAQFYCRPPDLSFRDVSTGTTGCGCGGAGATSMVSVALVWWMRALASCVRLREKRTQVAQARRASCARA